MFIIKPIQDKELQKQYCALCGIPYYEQAMAYKAELEGEFGGICQFELKKGCGVIHHLRPAPNVDDFEMMFIMGRSTMNFIDLCELHTCYAPQDAAEHRLLIGIGFKKQEDGSYFVDMHGMFGGCGNH